MPPFLFEQISEIAGAFIRYEDLTPGLTANLALFLGLLGKPGCELELSGKEHPDQIRYLHLRLPQYIGTVGNFANPPHAHAFEARLFFDHAGTGSQLAIIRNRKSIENLKEFEVYKMTMLKRFAEPKRESVSLSFLLKNRAQWLDVLQLYLGRSCPAD